METTTRNATLTDLADLLKNQQARKIDLVVPASQMRAVEGTIVVRGSEPLITDDGVTLGDGTYVPTAVFDEGVADKLGVPLGYVRRMRAERPDLWDANVNGWLHGRKAKGRPSPTTTTDGTLAGEWIETRPAIPGDQRSFLLRGFKGDDSNDGIARALLSDRYAPMDHLDVLTAALDGVRASGVGAQVHSADLTDRRMVVRVHAPEVAAMAPQLLAGYRSPFTGKTGDENPTVFAGFVITNSETGGGAYTITPQVIVEICTNGMTMTTDAMRKVHVGSRLEEGQINWSAETVAKELAVVTSKTTDAVRTFLTADYVQGAVDRLSARAGVAIEKPETEVRSLTKGLGFTTDQQDAVLAHFIKGGQVTMGGLVQAITAHAQEVPDGDDAWAMQTKATTLLGV